MTRWLATRSPEASPTLQLACRAQHFRRWEIPRSSYPMTRPGYLTWRAKLKSQAASQVAELLASPAVEPALAGEEIERVAALIRKENLKSDDETQILEDVACLVFLDDQFDEFEKKPEIDEEKIIGFAGRDATAIYSRVHADSIIQTTIPVSKRIGQLVTSTPLPPPVQPPSPPPPSSKPPLASLISSHDFAAAAFSSFPAKTFAFVSSAATDLHTHHANTAAYSAIGLRPRVLHDVTAVSIRTTILGHRVTAPIFCAPTSLGKTVHPEGERELGRACKSLGIAQVVSTSASFPLAEVMDAIRLTPPLPANGREQQQEQQDIPVFFQLYGVFLTVDAPVPGKREADERLAADESTHTPMSGTRAVNDAAGGALGRIMGKYIDASVSWADIAWLRGCLPSGVPIVLKGIQTAMDAVKAMEMGVEGIVVSNHGGRSLDTAPATVLVLLELQRCCPEVFDRMEVFVDGGVKRGTDVFKALCLGARAVGIGRGALYGLNYGAEGVRRYVEMLNDELETTMKMCGVTSLDQVHPGLLNTGAVDHLIPQSAAEEHPYAKWRRKPEGNSKL
ncbi:cytochrome b2 [Podospora appendiculata]|uniref:Cytochrome b2 n=1 Tax=Podospora appendiculata TaxID=314037 RepID=A0AAE1CAK6_9PEZI|nr:cytochrome b2 [Podospora appendiculata]